MKLRRPIARYLVCIEILDDHTNDFWYCAILAAVFKVNSVDLAEREMGNRWVHHSSPHSLGSAG